MRLTTASAALFVAAWLLVPAGRAQATADPDDVALLARSDLALAAPESFRMRLRVTPSSAPGRATEVEVWRSLQGTAVELLGERDAGKRFLQRPDGLWFLAPGARPVRLSPTHRLAAGLSLQEILVPSYSQDYRIEEVRREGFGEAEIVTFELVAEAPGLAFPRARYVVHAASARPLRVELLLGTGRVARVLEISEWAAPEGLEVRRMSLEDRLGRGGSLAVEVLELEPRAVPSELFELSPGS
jgi:hypothetical protein